MRTRTAIAIGVTAALSIVDGCSCSEPTARMSAPDSAAPPPECVSWCDGVGLLGSIDLGDGVRFNAIDGFVLASSSTSAAVLLRRDGGDAGARHVIATIDLERGAIDLGEEAEPIALHYGMSGSAFRATVDGYEEVVAYPSTLGSQAGGYALLGRIAWRADGSVAAASDLLMRMPTLLSPCACERPIAIASGASGDRAIAAVVEGPSLLYGVLDGTAAGETGTLLDLGSSSPSGATPISIVQLDDERAAVAWGGAADGLDPRTGGLAIGRIGEPDWAHVEIAGAPFDPGPIVTHTASGVAVVRFVSDTNDIGHSAARITRYDAESLAITSTTEIPTRYGLQPRSIAVLDSSQGPGIAFIDPGSAREADNLYVVPPNDSLACTNVQPIPSAGLGATVEIPIAASWTGDSALVALLTVDGALRVYQTGTCHVRRNDAE